MTFFLLFSAFIIIYPSKKESSNSFDYCYFLEKVISRNSVEKSQNVSKKVKTIAKDISLLGTKKTKGAMVNKIIDKYKNSKKSFIINFVPNQFYCLAGYWIEEVNPGIFISIFYEGSKEKIYKFNDIKKEVNQLINNINSEYEYIKKIIKKPF